MNFEGHKHIESIAGSIYIMVEGLTNSVIITYNIINKIYIYKIKYTYYVINISYTSDVSTAANSEFGYIVVYLGIFSNIPK